MKKACIYLIILNQALKYPEEFMRFYIKICHNFQEFLHSLDFDEIQALKLDMQANRGGLLPIENYSDATELMLEFDLFYYKNRRFPFTTGLLPIPDGNFPVFVVDQKISIKKLYEQFRSSLAHGIMAVPFLCTLNLILSGDPKKLKSALTELYHNLSLEVLSNEYETCAVFDAIGDLTAEINLNLQKAISSNRLKREEDEEKYIKIKQKFTTLSLKNAILRKQRKKPKTIILISDQKMLSKLSKNFNKIIKILFKQPLNLIR